MTNTDCGCDCCGGAPAVPTTGSNRPGLLAITRRAATHATSNASMLARLSSTEHPALAGLRTRDPDDFSIAILDAWSAVSDVLSFYTERIAQESYLGTATEWVSLSELGGLIGYVPRPGVASSAAIALTIETAAGALSSPGALVRVPVGTKIQTVPGQDETAQTFETVEAIDARGEWNAMLVAQTGAKKLTSKSTAAWFEGVALDLKAGDMLLFVADDTNPLSWAHRRLKTVDVEYEAKRTRVSWATAIDVVGDRPDVVVCAMRQRANLFGHNVKRWDALPLSQRIGEVIKGTPPQGLLEAVGLAVKSKIADPPVADVASSLSQWVGSIESAVAGAQTSFSLLPDPGDLPGLRSASARLSSARDKISAPASPPDGWFPDFPGALNDMVDAAVSLGDATVEMAMRLPAAADAVGAAVSKTGSAYLQLRVREAQGYLHLMTNVGAALQDVAVRMQRGEDTRIAGPYAEMREHWADANLDKTLTHVFLDAQYANLAAGSWIVLASREETILRRVETVDDLTHSAYDLTLKVTRLGIDSPLAKGFSPWSANVLLKSERLALARPPRSSAVSGESIELDRRIHGFEAGRRVVIEGVLVGGGKGAESAILDRAEVTTDATTLYLRTSLRNSYQRGGCRVLGNVALATHGEAVHDVLGSGDASTANQVFALKQGPLTFVAAENELGAATTLEVRVADERWLEVSTLVGRGPTDHVYTSARSRDGRTTVSFGDGVEGARLPTGTNSVRARYRKGVGLSGNVKAEQISQLMTKPLGLASARNPVEANGGDDAASAEHLRSGAPTSVHTLGRVVSLVDYEDFARAFAGIAKAHSRWASGDGIVVTIAGPGGLIIPAGGATENALVNALRAAGEPFLSVSIVPHRSRAASISGRVVIDPAFDAEVVRQSIEARMRTDFGFAARSFGQSLRSSEVVASLHAVRGVVAVDIDLSLSAPPQSGSGAILITLADSPLDLEIAR